MSALTADKQGVVFGHGSEMLHQVAASTKIFKRAIVGLSSGYARNLVAGDPFAGLAREQVDNSAGSAGDLSVPCDFPMVKASISGLAVTDIGKDVFATTSNLDDLSLTQSTNTRVGKVGGVISTGYGWVQLEPTAGYQAELGGTLTGTLDGDLADCGDTSTGDRSATINKNFKELQTAVNAIVRRLGH